MSRLLAELETHRVRSEMISAAMRDLEDSYRVLYGSPYAAMSGALQALLIMLAADRMDSTEDLVRQLKNLTANNTKTAVA